MHSTFRWIAMITLILVPAPTWAADGDTNFVEIDLIRDEVSGEDHEYWVFAEFGKDGANTCSLTTPSGTVPCPMGWLAQRLTFAQLQTLIGSSVGPDWTIVWDQGPSQTTAEIDFGTVSLSDWPKVPSIDSPKDGAIGVSPSTSIDWSYVGGAEDPLRDRVEACVTMTRIADLTFAPGELTCLSDSVPDPLPEPLNETSWTPPLPLEPGLWDAFVLSDNDIRDVPSGITVTQGSWPIENSEWLAAVSMDISTFEVPFAVPALESWIPVGLLLGLLAGAGCLLLCHRFRIV